MIKTKQRLWRQTVFVTTAAVFALLASCELYYGEVGGADEYETIYTLPDIFPGVWYSHYPYADHYRTDGYRMASIAELKKDPAMKEKIRADYPDIAFDDNDEPVLRVDSGTPFSDSDYYLYYDDLSGGSWGFTYMGVVRAVNMFKNALESTTLSYGGGTYSNVSSGAVIIEYFSGAYPKWEPVLAETPLPYFGMFYRILTPNIIQMANPIELGDLAQGLPYYTETASLEEAVIKYCPANEGEFVAWGIALPQEREP